jgi:Protein of unknown function (DUF1460)
MMKRTLFFCCFLSLGWNGSAQQLMLKSKSADIMVKPSDKPSKIVAKPKTAHQQIFETKMQLPLPLQPNIVSSVNAIGKSFLGTPYVYFTLDSNHRTKTRLKPMSKEVLVVNLKQLDCVTFVENTVALSQTRLDKNNSFENYKQKLQKIRYRNGVVDYAARHHYFTDWMFEQEQKGLLKDITKDLGGEPYQKTVTIMTHKKDTAYGNMADPKTFEAIRQVEAAINKRPHFYIPEEKIPAIENKLLDGDIVAITTHEKRIEIAHVGFIVKRNGRAHLMHASSVKKQVVITEEPMADYLMKNKGQSGVMIARLQ